MDGFSKPCEHYLQAAHAAHAAAAGPSGRAPGPSGEAQQPARAVGRGAPAAEGQAAGASVAGGSAAGAHAAAAGEPGGAVSSQPAAAPGAGSAGHMRHARRGNAAHPMPGAHLCFLLQAPGGCLAVSSVTEPWQPYPSYARGLLQLHCVWPLSGCCYAQRLTGLFLPCSLLRQSYVTLKADDNVTKCLVFTAILCRLLFRHSNSFASGPFPANAYE